MWVPYRNLFYLGLLQSRSQYKKATEEQITDAAKRRAEQLVVSAFPVLSVYTKDAAFDPWPDTPAGAADDFKNVKFSRELEAFILRGRRGSREILDRLILAYACHGFGAETAYEEAFNDYETVSGVVKLDKRDVFTYGTFFWDFPSLFNLREGGDWLRSHTLDMENDILGGELSLDDVRSLLGVVRGLDFDHRLQVLTMKNMRVMDRVLDQLLKKEVDFTDSGRHATDYLRNSAAFVASAISMMKLYRDVSEDSGGETSLEDIIRLKMTAANAAMEAEGDVPDWMSLQRDDITPDDLRAINEAINAEQS
jgi:hypothetical protein